MKRLTLATCAAACACAASADDFSIDPRATYLRTSSDPAQNASALDLAALGLAPGDYVRITRLGDYDNGPRPDDRTNMIGVFSGSDTLLGSAERYRVPDAINAGIDFTTADTYYNSLTTDIPEDFLISGTGVPYSSVLVRIPAGASHVFICTHDSLYYDNSDPDGDWAVRIEHVACPVDMTGEGVVNTADFVEFLNLWTAQEQPGDFDGNGIFNTADFVLFLNLYAQGCD